MILLVSVLDMTEPRGHLWVTDCSRSRESPAEMRHFIPRQFLILVWPQLARGRRRKSQYDPLKAIVRGVSFEHQD